MLVRNFPLHKFIHELQYFTTFPPKTAFTSSNNRRSHCINPWTFSNYLNSLTNLILTYHMRRKGWFSINRHPCLAVQSMDSDETISRILCGGYRIDPDYLIQVIAANFSNRRHSRWFPNIAEAHCQVTPIMSNFSQSLDGLCILDQPQTLSSFTSDVPLVHSISHFKTCIPKYHNAIKPSVPIIFLVLLNSSVHILLYMYISSSSSAWYIFWQILKI